MQASELELPYTPCADIQYTKKEQARNMSQQLRSVQGDSQPVEPRVANGAQVPLDDFNIPQFPREAGGLMALTLTSAISVDRYTEVLQQPFLVTHLPPSIQSLTLELFALGYPAGFLKALIAELPELRSLIIFSQLFTGTSKDTVQDAIAFIRDAKKIRALHLLDAFVAPDFVKGIAPLLKQLEKPLMFIEINYTNRVEEKGFFDRVPAGELPLLIHPGLVSCSLNIAPPEASNKSGQAGEEAHEEGIQTLDSQYSEGLIMALLDEATAPQVMKHLNITLYSISIHQLKQVVTKHKGLMVLNVSLKLDNDSQWKTGVFNALATGEKLEQIEIVLCPVSSTADLDITIEEHKLIGLAGICKKLTSFKVNQLRRSKSRTSVDCFIVDGKWKIDLNQVKDYAKPKKIEAAKPKTKERWSPWT